MNSVNKKYILCFFEFVIDFSAINVYNINCIVKKNGFYGREIKIMKNITKKLAVLALAGPVIQQIKILLLKTVHLRLMMLHQMMIIIMTISMQIITAVMNLLRL